MSTKLALMLSGVWTLLLILGCSGMFWYVATKVPRHQQDERAKMFGSGAGVFGAIGYGAIVIAWAIAWRRRREEQAADDDEEDERPRRPRRKRDR
jgi:predicted permease